MFATWLAQTQWSQVARGVERFLVHCFRTSEVRHLREAPHCIRARRSTARSVRIGRTTRFCCMRCVVAKQPWCGSMQGKSLKLIKLRKSLLCCSA